MIAEENRYAVLLPLMSISVSGLINMFYLTPKVGKVIKERFQQGLFPCLFSLSSRWCMYIDGGM